jgi:hypothetical protein
VEPFEKPLETAPIDGQPDRVRQQAQRLREIHTACPLETVDYIDRRVLAIAPLAWSAATEKLDRKEKARLNAARKAARSGNRPVAANTWRYPCG